ncbi:MAG TPA: response regulator [Patescibacteria group bacterium]|nr:response regulator [Patescibacteria group bacterium]
MNKTVLIVDDDEGILDALSLVIATAGYTVIATVKGEEAYETAKKQRPDIILLDVLLSGSNGRDICEQLKKDDITKYIPVLMISAHPSGMTRAFACGADDFLAKPFDVDVLLEKVQQGLCIKHS